ncbi:Hint domain-containing protein [Pseudooceanicola nanhaiensis]|uniref:Hint domain-containing protein n=1 Tax=Pseudooceanicola nanhaiensis TaxID=375761 RepID=UPI0021E5CAB5|nr:Hint domain-containing protein [Pseudooceanicola nanhaiensis]
MTIYTSNCGCITPTDSDTTGSKTGDGIVSGNNEANRIDLAYTGDPEGDMIDNDDAILPGEEGDDDIVVAGGGNDTIYTGEGNDEVYGGGGDDFINVGYGDNLVYADSNYDPETGEPVDAREVFQWSLTPDTTGDGELSQYEDTPTTFTQNTGSVNVTFTISSSNLTPITQFDGNEQLTDGIEDDGSDVDSHSSLASWVQENGESATYEWDFDEEVTDVSFRINDIDYDSNVVICAYDADGNFIDVTLDAGDSTIVNGSSVSADDSITDPTDVSTSVLVSIEGPVSKIVICHTQDGDHSSEVNVTDIYFDVPDGNDTLLGGTGNDTLYGEGGDDVFYSSDGNDEMYGGDNDRDVFKGATAGDFIDGGSGDEVDYDTLDLRGSAPDGGSLKVIYSDTNPEDGTVEFYDADDELTGTATFEDIENVIPCFTPGTLIATPKGERLVEELRAGDRIITRDNGIQEIRWTGARQMSAQELARASHLRPVLIQKGSLGYGLPERDMLVSPNHRVLVNNDKTALYFEEREVLVAAKHLVGLKGIDTVDTMGTTYIHFMFDRHEVVLSDGSWTESFQPGHQTLDGLGNAQRNEIFELFPELKEEEGVSNYAAARRTLKRHEAALLAK